MFDFCLVGKDVEQLLTFLIAHHVLLGSWWCPNCGQLCQISAFVANAIMSVVTLIIVDGGGGVAISEACSRALSISQVCHMNCLWLGFRVWG